MYGRIHEDLSTRLTPPSRKRTVFRGAQFNISNPSRYSLGRPPEQLALTKEENDSHGPNGVVREEWVLLVS